MRKIGLPSEVVLGQRIKCRPSDFYYHLWDDNSEVDCKYCDCTNDRVISDAKLFHGWGLSNAENECTNKVQNSCNEIWRPGHPNPFETDTLLLGQPFRTLDQEIHSTDPTIALKNLRLKNALLIFCLPFFFERRN